MRAEIISIGTELLLGHTINSDAALVARVLAEYGLELRHVQTVGDNAEDLAQALELAASRSDMIITTGGLGPTDDDLSKETVARFARAPLVENAEALRHLAGYFGERPMSPNQIRQAYLPAGSIMLPNTIGTAPGCIVPFGAGQRVVMLPGPPRELEAMLRLAVAPFLAELASGTFQSAIIRTFGIGEGAAAHMIRDLMQAANPVVAPYATGGEMFVKVTAFGRDKTEAQTIAGPVIEEIRGRLGNLVYGIDAGSLEEVVLAELVASHRTIATAESCTGGLLAKRLTDLPGSSAAFQMGVITYSNQAKQEMLGIPASTLEKFGAVSSQTAEAMATSVRRLANTYYGIGITGIAGPDGATQDKPLGLVYIALATPDACLIRKTAPQGRYLGREFTRERAASHALDMLRRNLQGLDEPQEHELFMQSGGA